MAREQVSKHWSSQNLILSPLPNFHLKFILAAHITSFQKGELFLSLKQNNFQEQVWYLQSTVAF
jgi:hypothetical protein